MPPKRAQKQPSRNQAVRSACAPQSNNHRAADGSQSMIIGNYMTRIGVAA